MPNWLGGLFNKRSGSELGATTPLTIPTVKFDSHLVTPAVGAEIVAALKFIPEISDGSLAVVYVAALECVSAGGDLHVLAKALIDIGVAKPRAGEIARLVSRRARSVIERNRQAATGITEAEWLHSGAPCVSSPKDASPLELQQDADHRAASGRRYQVLEGMLMGGRRVWPSQDPGCRCVSKSIIAGF